MRKFNLPFYQCKSLHECVGTFRSSLRKPQSPRSAIADHSEAAGTAAYCGPSMAGAARSPAAAAGDSTSRRSAEGVLKSRGGLKRESSFVRQKSNLTLTSGRSSAPSSATRQSATATSVQKSVEAAKKSPAVISSGSGYGSPPPLLTAMNSNNNNNNSPRKTIAPPMERNAAAAMTANPQGRVIASMGERTSCATAAAGVRGSPLVLSSGTFNRRLTATLSPEECKMMFTHTEKVSKAPLFYLLKLILLLYELLLSVVNEKGYVCPPLGYVNIFQIPCIFFSSLFQLKSHIFGHEKPTF
jgi:hypothetical protein